MVTEHQIQCAAFEQIAVLRNTDWRYSLVYAIPNGGHRPGKTGAHMKREGAQSGVWDITVDYPVSPYCGMKIEVKRPGKKLSASQKTMGSLYLKANWCLKICYSSDAIVGAIEEYLRGDNTSSAQEAAGD